MEEAQPCQFLRFANLRRTPGRARPLCTPGTALPLRSPAREPPPQLGHSWSVFSAVPVRAGGSACSTSPDRPGRAAGAMTGPAGQLWREPEWCHKQLM